MKKHIFKLAPMSLALFAMTLSSCADEFASMTHTGTLSLSNMGVEVKNAELVEPNKVYGTRASVDVSDFLVDICSADGSRVLKSYVYGRMPEVITLEPEQYSVRVRSHEVQPAEWARPYYTGTSEVFTITENEITEIAPIKCSFASMKVDVKFGPKLKTKIGNDVKVTVVANDNGTLVYTPYEDKGSGYFAAVEGSTTMVASFEGTVNGVWEISNLTYTDMAPGVHRTITYECGDDTPTPEAPSGSLNPVNGISVDVYYTDENLTGEADPGDEEVISGGTDKPGLPDLPNQGGDDPKPNEPGEDPIDDPTPSTAPITYSGTLANNGVYYADELTKANVVIKCSAGCKDINVVIDSEFLTPDELGNVGLASRFSLVNDDQYFETLEELNLPCNASVRDQTEIDFDITDFLTMLSVTPGRGKTNKFTLSIEDNNGEKSTFTFTIKVKP